MSKKAKEIKESPIRGYMAISDEEKSKKFNENFKGEVNDELEKFPRELGVKHPFPFEDAEDVYRNHGLLTGACNKIVDNIIGEFKVKCKDAKAKILIDGFIKNSDLQINLREWILEAVVKGNGFLEIDLKKQKVRVLNANNMYVVRDKFGNIKGYNQYIGKFKNFSLQSKSLTSFFPNEIAHLTFNRLSGDAYGLGLLKPSERIIDFIMQDEDDVHKLVTRKAGAPIHVRVGQPGEVVDKSTVDEIKNALVFMTNRTEWVTDSNVEFNVLQFGEIGKNLTDLIQHDIRTLCAGLQIPEVMLNSGQLNEGIGDVQKKSFQQTIASYQEDIETLIENKIFEPYLISNGLKADVEFIWNLPGEEEINSRLTQLNTILSNQYLSDGMRMQIQLEIGRLLNIENAEELVKTPNTQGMTADKQPVFGPDGKQYTPKSGTENKDESGTERKKEEEIKQPEIPGEKNVKQEAQVILKEAEKVEVKDNSEKKCVCKTHLNESDYNSMTLKEFVNLQEIAGFNYSDYLIRILARLKTDKFNDLKAITEKDVENGMFTEEQVEKLRQILKDAFRKNKSIADIESEIKNNIPMKDRITENGATIPAETRPNMISRTETIRLANLGLLDTYKENNITKVRWLAALSDRTCEQCDSHNGEVMTIEESYGKIPLHVNCRCTWLSILE